MTPLLKGSRRKPILPLGLIFTFFFLFIFVQFNSSCSQYDSGVGGSTISTPDLGEMKEAIIPVTATANQVVGDRLKSTASLMVLGQQDGMVSEMFYQFTDFSAFGDTVLAVNSGEFIIHASGFADSAGAEDGTPWTATVKRIDEPVTFYELKYDDELLMTDIGSFEFGTADTTDSVTFTLDIETLERWLQDTLSYGIKIVPDDGANFLKRFFAQQSVTDPSVQPKLYVNVDFQVGDIVYEDSTIIINPQHNTFLVNDELALNEDRLQITSGFAKRMLFSGDFSDMRSDLVSLNRAELVLHNDKEWAHQLGEAGYFTWYNLDREWVQSGEVDSVVGDIPSSLAYSVRTDTNAIRLNITPIVKWWIVQPDSNFGVSVRYISESGNLGRLAFHNIVDGDTIDTFEEAMSTLQPYFYLIFTEFAEQ